METIEKIKYFVEKVPRDQGIIGLIKLQIQVPENEKFKCRIACLHLMEINHDWENIRKFIIQWKVVKTFGKELISRMRKRVDEEKGQIPDDQQSILKQLDRLNEKNWRQFSPKKNFPDFANYLAEPKLKQSKNKPIEVKKQQNSQTNKVEKQEGSQRQRSSNIASNSIFSKISQLAKDEKNKEVLPKGLFTNPILQRSQSNQSLQKKKKIQNQKTSAVHEFPKQRSQGGSSQESKKIVGKKQQSSQLQRKVQGNQQKATTPSKQPKKVIVIKYGGQKQRQKIKEQSKDQFSFSAVKARQVHQGFSQKKNLAADQIDNSFLNFTNDSRIKQRNQRNQFASQRKDNILDEIAKQDQFLRSSRYIPNKPLFTEQQINLIQPSKPPINYIKQILKAEGKSAADMLRMRLKIQ